MCILLLGESHLPGPVASVMMLWRAMSASLFSSEDRYRGRLVRALALSLVTFVLFLDPALAWQVTLPDTFGNTSGAPRGLAVDAEGNIFTAGDQSNRFVVTKLSGSTGQVLWRTIVQGSTIIAGVGLSVAVDSAGQVVASGQLTSSALHTEFAVVKLDGATGVERWRFLIDRPDGYASRVAFDNRGDVVASGRVLFGSYAFFVVKLSGLNGSERWRRSEFGIGGTSEAQTLALDPAGDAIAAGYIANSVSNTSLLVEKLSGTTGVPVWNFRIDTSGITYSAANRVVLDQRGDVLGAGRLTNGSTRAVTFKLSGVSGGELWRTTIDGGLGDFDTAESVAADGSGDAMVAGSLDLGQGLGRESFVIKVSGDSGMEKWRRIVRGSADHSSDFAFTVAVDAGNDAVEVGKTQNIATGYDWTAVKLDGSTGEEMWRTDVTGTAADSDDDFANLLGIDSCANVVVGGQTQNAVSRFDFTVVKLSGASGFSSETFKEGPCAPPHASIAPQGAVECAGSSGGVVTLDGSASTDDDSSPGTNDDIQSFEWFEDYGQATQRSLGKGARLAVTLPLGAHTIGLKVTDRAGLSDVGQETVTIVDTTPPALNCPAETVEECNSPGGSRVTLIATASDACSPTVTITNSATAGGGDASGFFALGTTEVTFKATDASGNTATCTVPVTARDTTPPTLALALSPTVLSPPNHRMVSVQVAWQASDVCDPSVVVVIVSATSSEPDDVPGAGDGNTTGDIQDASIGTPDASVLLRAERMAGGPGRVYTLMYTATDASRNSTSAIGLVTVPHDLSTGPEPGAPGI